MSIRIPELTFGIEIERTNFWNGKPIISHIGSVITNDETYKDSRGHVTIVTERSNGQCQEKFLKVVLVDEKENPVRELDLTEEGQLMPPWDEWEGFRDQYAIQPNIEGSVLDQVEGLFRSFDLNGWKVEADETLSRSSVDSIELISPVLKAGDTSSIKKVCEVFSDITDTDESCGLHVHIGMEDSIFQYKFLKRFVLDWIKSEPKLDRMVSYEKERVSNKPLSGRLKAAKKSTRLRDLIEAVNPDGRNYRINLRSLLTYGTIEFRGFESTLDFHKIVEIVNLCESKVRKSL